MRDNIMAGRHAKLYPGTPAEHAIEPAVASLGVPYRWQYPMYLLGPLKYFPDFALPTLMVVLEIDDSGHARKAKRLADAERTAKLEAAGWRVARCTNQEALTDPYGTVDRMMASLNIPLTTKEISL